MNEAEFIQLRKEYEELRDNGQKDVEAEAQCNFAKPRNDTCDF